MKKHILALFIVVLLTLGVRFAYQYGSIEKGEIGYYQDNTGHLYLQGYDPYVYYSEARLNHQGGFTSLLIYWHKLLVIILPGISLMGSIGYYPLLFMSLSAILIYAIIFYISKELWIAFFGASLFAINPFLFQSSIIGMGDSNAVIYFFSLLILLQYMIMIDKRKLWLTIPFIATTYLFSMVWSGWLYVMVIIAYGNLVYVIVEGVIKAKKVKIINIIILLIMFVALILMFSRMWDNTLIRFYMEDDAKTGMGFNYIAELSHAAIFDIINMSMFWYIIIFTIIISPIYTYCSRDKRIYILAAYLLMTSIAGLINIRFLFYALLGYYLLMPMILYDMFKDRIKNNNPCFLGRLVILLIIIALSLNVIKGSYYYVGKPWLSVMNDDIMSQLQNLNASRPIIAMWDKEPFIYAMTNKSIANTRSDLTGKSQTVMKGFASVDNYDYYFRNLTNNESYYVLIFPNDRDIMENIPDNYGFNDDSFLAINSRKGYKGLVIYES